MTSANWVSPRDVANVFDISTKTVLRGIYAGKLKAFKVGHQWRISWKSVDQWLVKGATKRAARKATDDDATKSSQELGQEKAAKQKVEEGAFCPIKTVKTVEVNGKRGTAYIDENGETKYL